MCHGIVDLHYKQNPTKVAASSANKQKVVPTVNVSKTITSNALRTKSMYSNCVMEAPDGQVLCVCDAKKAQWYCEKGLAENVTKDGAEDMVIRLKFEPRGRPSGERDYYRSKKKNICVVCGADKSFIRKNIVPREYRKYLLLCMFSIRHFPEILKSHSSHDVVLLCASCHKKTGIFDQEYKEHFAQLCNAPYKSGGVTIDSDLKKVKSAARTLSGYADKLPEEKLVECQRILTQFFGTEAITDDVLQSACNLDDSCFIHIFVFIALLVKVMQAVSAYYSSSTTYDFAHLTNEQH
ncbi:hypothetical protein EB796_024148 [Bugula neritina]|uniref:Uncharacterized protein n=1 Tax=Bugula neritina TaxID=10212 RepID=A0A7J7IUB8_BUGNE|nr:hypothetical protein EB796_024148 [Bugula neritina]